MSLQEIDWNNLYAAQPHQRHFTEARIRSHFTRKRLESRGIVRASVRPTGWHGESGAARSGGHVVVDFQLSDGSHVTTHHIYPSDDAYHDILGRT
ncbi:hypothetical protein BYT27DRAFT_7249661 [Phlegmacium glaucopus]|nr:hypothetical protein BYT27DRAFT_7249661 [Phlegmacium glaucopus]